MYIFGTNIDLDYNEAKNFRLQNEIAFPSLTGSDGGFVFFHSGLKKFYGWDSTSWLELTGSGGGGGTTSWGGIIGTLSDQTDLQTVLDNKVDLTSTQTISGQKTFDTLSTKFDIPMNLKSGVPTTYSGYNSFGVSNSGSTFFFTKQSTTLRAEISLASIATTTKVFTLPNKDGTFAMLDDLALYALDSAVVHKTGVESISGTKTFSASGSSNILIFNGSSTSSTAADLYLTHNNPGTGSGFIINGSASSAGYLFEGRSNGSVTFTLDKLGNVASNTLNTIIFTVATLPTGVTGARACVNDATATTFYSVVAGGGSNTVPVFYNGTNWIIG